jgi:dipeptidyl aminopeptidase/acylaminoacyl peptidase
MTNRSNLVRRLLTSPPQLETAAIGVLFAVSLLSFAAPVPGFAQAQVMELADLGREVGLSGPRISPDGQQVVLVTSRVSYEENRFNRSLVLVKLATGEQEELTPHRPRVSDPAWSPLGGRIAFLDSEAGKPAQLYVLPLGGGEARRVTDVAEGVEFYGWSPDGTHFIFGTAEVLEEKEGEERHNKSFEVGDNSYLTHSAPMPTHLWRIPVEGGEAERLTAGPENVDGFVWAPDGRSIALVVRPKPHTGERRRSIQLMELASRERRELAAGSVGAPVYSPDGSLIAFSQPRGAEPGFVPDGVFVVATDGGAPRDVTASIDRDLGSPVWLTDGTGLLVRGADRTRRVLWLQSLDGTTGRLDLGAVDPASTVGMSDHGRAAFIGREPDHPSELYVMESPAWLPRRVTSFNEELGSRNLGKVETVSWSGPDGFEEDGVLVYPPDFVAGSNYPLVLNIHGGPMSASTEGFSAFDQIMAARGWLVFKPNYRGSNNQGSAFQRAVVNDAGDGPGRDVMAGIEMLKARRLVDEDRIAVSGWSYGGYMTAWLTSHYDGWAAAVAGAAVTDWFDWYNMADMNTWAGFGLGGSPWLNDNAENYWRQSPMAYAHRIRTPTLILSNTGDERVTVSQSYKLYHALKDNGVEVRFIAYPVAGHFPGDPVHQRDLRSRWVHWIEEHFAGAGEGSR